MCKKLYAKICRKMCKTICRICRIICIMSFQEIIFGEICKHCNKICKICKICNPKKICGRICTPHFAGGHWQATRTRTRLAPTHRHGYGRHWRPGPPAHWQSPIGVRLRVGVRGSLRVRITGSLARRRGWPHWKLRCSTSPHGPSRTRRRTRP